MPAPHPTTNTERKWGCINAGKWPNMSCNRMSSVPVEASILPLTWKLRTLVPFISVTATDAFIPSPM